MNFWGSRSCASYRLLQTILFFTDSVFVCCLLVLMNLWLVKSKMPFGGRAPCRPQSGSSVFVQISRSPSLLFCISSDTFLHHTVFSILHTVPSHVNEAALSGCSQVPSSHPSCPGSASCTLPCHNNMHVPRTWSSSMI